MVGAALAVADVPLVQGQGPVHADDVADEPEGRPGLPALRRWLGEKGREEAVSGESDKPEVWGDGCECWVTPEHMWFRYGSAVEPGSQVEWNPDCPKHRPIPRAEEAEVNGP